MAAAAALERRRAFDVVPLGEMMEEMKTVKTMRRYIICCWTS